jgi:hypothetical protein
MRGLLVVAGLLTLVAVGCDGHTSVQGRVVDHNGNPVPGADVKLVERPDEPGRGTTRSATTDESGHFGLGITHEPSKTVPFRFEVTKDGYSAHVERFTGTAGYEKEIVLQPARK